LFSLPETNEVWIRVVGMLVLLLGFYYFQASKNEMIKFFQWSVYARAVVPIFFIVFVLLDFAPPILILFGVIDAAAALWTHLSLRSEKQL
jgi:CDP-diglyceride synthetase